MTPSNPFCTRFVQPGAIRYRFPDDQNEDLALNSICNRLQYGRSALIIGPHGSGKSTLLRSLMPMLNQRYPSVASVQLCQLPATSAIDRIRQGRQNWREIHQRWLSLSGRDLLIIDGIEQLRSRDRFRLLQGCRIRGPSILATSHRKLFATRVVFETKIDRCRSAALTEQLIENLPIALAALVRAKLANHDWDRGTNLRDFWFDCYDVVQTEQRQTLDN